MSGFVYIWYDRKHKRFYIGKHWGTLDDGYVCSSKWMKQAYVRRPEDFKRRILQKISTNRTDLNEAERQWGLLIKKEELSKRYYNLKLPGGLLWSDDPKKRLKTAEKISITKRGVPKSEETKHKMSQKRATIETKRKMSLSATGKQMSEETKEKLRVYNTGRKASEETKRKMSQPRKPLSEERKQKISESLKGKPSGMIGRIHSEETKQKMRETWQNKRLDTTTALS